MIQLNSRRPAHTTQTTYINKGRLIHICWTRIGLEWVWTYAANCKLVQSQELERLVLYRPCKDRKIRRSNIGHNLTPKASLLYNLVAEILE